jgi:hypothetical protein
VPRILLRTWPIKEGDARLWISLYWLDLSGNVTSLVVRDVENIDVLSTYPGASQCAFEGKDNNAEMRC